MKLHSHHSLAAAICIAVAVLSQAQARTCRIVFPERPNDFPREVHLYDGTQNHSIMVPSKNFSPVLQLPDGDITIALLSEPVEEAADVPAGAASLLIPENISDLYILVTPTEGAKNLPISLTLVDASPARLKPGQTMWLNLTGKNIQANLGDNRVLIDGKRHVITEKPVPESGYYKASFSLIPEEDGAKPQLFTNQNWWHDVKSRHMGLILDQGGKLPSIIMLRDFRAPNTPGSQ